MDSERPRSKRSDYSAIHNDIACFQVKQVVVVIVKRDERFMGWTNEVGQYVFFLGREEDVLFP